MPPPSIAMPQPEHKKIKLRKYSEDPWHPDEVQQFIDSWRLTPEQVEKLWKLQRKLKDVHHWKNDPEHVLRFMFAPHGYDAAEANFRKMVQWRLDNNIDTILEDYTPPQKLLDYTVAAMLHGFDKDGDPIYVERGGAGNVWALLKELGHDEMLKYAIWTRELQTRGEWLDRFEQLQSRRIRYSTVIYDLEGLCTKHMNPKTLELFGDISKITQEYYPGPIKRIIVIRAPSIFRYVWAVAKHFFRQSIRDKMIFAGKNYIEVLDRFIDRDVLPPSIVPNGCGRVAIGMPPLIGDFPQQATTILPQKGVDDFYYSDSDFSSSGRIPSAASLGESDHGSASSTEIASCDGSVSTSILVKGHWMESENGSHVCLHTRLA